jgi:polygalacturonase
MRSSFNRIFFAGYFLVALVSGASAQSQKTIADEVKRYCTNLPFGMPEIPVPTFPDRRMSIVEYGAIADGHTMNTRAFADAIAACVRLGGGTVLVPPGTWLTGPIKIESNINLHLERGALVQFSKRIDDFPLVPGLDGNSKRYIILPPVSAYRATNISITGDGIIDGAGEAWRYVKKEKQTERQWKELVASGGAVTADGREWWPSKEAMNGQEYLKAIEKSGRIPTGEDYAKVREYLRPDLVQLVQCNGILLDGVTFQNSPKFHVRPIQSENVIIRNVKVFSPWYGQNNDGIDPASCRNVVIYNTIVDVGDDGLCLKPGTIAKSQKPGPSCENIVIADCAVYHAHGGFVIGSESYGGVNNVSVRNCVFIGTDVGVRFKSMRGNGGLVENVFIDGIRMKDIQNEAILFDMYYGGGAPEVEAQKVRDEKRPEPVTDRTPRFQNISFKNMVCIGASRAVLVNGLPEMPVKNIRFEKLDISSRTGLLFMNADGVEFMSATVGVKEGAVVALNQSSNITLRKVEYSSNASPFLKVDGETSSGIKLVGIDLSKAEKAIQLGEGVRASAVTQEPGQKE